MAASMSFFITECSKQLLHHHSSAANSACDCAEPPKDTSQSTTRSLNDRKAPEAILRQNTVARHHYSHNKAETRTLQPVSVAHMVNEAPSPHGNSDESGADPGFDGAGEMSGSSPECQPKSAYEAFYDYLLHGEAEENDNNCSCAFALASHFLEASANNTRRSTQWRVVGSKPQVSALGLTSRFEPDATAVTAAPHAPVSLSPLCNHRRAWKRQRGRHGLHHFICKLCGSRWLSRAADGSGGHAAN